MKASKNSDISETIDAYIAAADPKVKPILRQIRKVVREAAPEAEEIISYRMPAFRQGGILIYFAAFKKHIGVFPPVTGDEKLIKAAAPYAGPKGNLQFPLDQPIPFKLISQIVKHRVKLLKTKSHTSKSLSRKRPQKSS